MNENNNSEDQNSILFDGSINILKIISVKNYEKRNLDSTEIFETENNDQE